MNRGDPRKHLPSVSEHNYEILRIPKHSRRSINPRLRPQHCSYVFLTTPRPVFVVLSLLHPPVVDNVARCCSSIRRLLRSLLFNMFENQPSPQGETTSKEGTCRETNPRNGPTRSLSPSFAVFHKSVLGGGNHAWSRTAAEEGGK